MEFVLTILVPLYNEQENLWKLKEEMDKYLTKTEVASKVLFVNDGSTDSSQEIINEICNSNQDQYSYIELSKNSGLSTAIKAGIDYCDTELIGYIDSDVQTTPLDFINYFPFFPEYDLVTGIRANRKDTFIKKLSSKIANAFRRAMINDGIEDTGCPLKIMKTSFAKRIPFFDGMHRFLPALIQLQNGKVKQIEIQHFPRYAGTAKYRFWNRLRKPLVDIVVFRWIKSRYINYELKK